MNKITNDNKRKKIKQKHTNLHGKRKIGKTIGREGEDDSTMLKIEYNSSRIVCQKLSIIVKP